MDFKKSPPGAVKIVSLKQRKNLHPLQKTTASKPLVANRRKLILHLQRNNQQQKDIIKINNQTIIMA
jgi:hypothetical protein